MVCEEALAIISWSWSLAFVLVCSHCIAAIILVGCGGATMTKILINSQLLHIQKQ
jgi:hypothetical protein